jgi:hypothetical protein
MQRIAFAAIAAALVASASGSAVPSTGHVHVYFLQGEQVVRLTRPGSSPASAVRQLFRGPTPAEARRGTRTYVPPGTPLRRASVANGLATVDVGRRFISLRTRPSLLARLSQLVGTVTGIQGATRVQLLIDGKRVSGVFPGVPTESPITFRFLQTPDVPVPVPPPPRLRPPDPHVKQIQKRLIGLGYLLPGSADGRLGPVTEEGILAFQKWERLDRTGSLNAPTESRLATAAHPEPISRGMAGKRAEILLDRQVALLIAGNKVVRTIAVSSGKPSTPTRPGNFRVYAKIPRWWSTPFREWLPWALPFDGGIAFHEFLVVPSFPASHGCVRQAVAVAQWTYAFAEVGMPVKVIASS